MLSENGAKIVILRIPGKNISTIYKLDYFFKTTLKSSHTGW